MLNVYDCSTRGCQCDACRIERGETGPFNDDEGRTEADASAPGLSEREIADTVNKVRDIALQFHATQQLRGRIARVLVPILTRASAAQSPGLSDEELMGILRNEGAWPELATRCVRAIRERTRASAATVGEASKLGLTGDRLTEEKAAHIMQRDGYAVTGYVLAQPDGRRCIVEKSAVRWLTKDEAWNLMHPSEAAQQQAEPVEADPYLEGIKKRWPSGEQQAEPGAGERAAFEAAYRNGCAEVTMRRNRDGRYEHDVQNVAWQIWQRARAAQSGQRAGVAEEWQLVPKEPTHAMHLAGETQWENSGNASPEISAIYRAMLAAAPTQHD